MDSLVVFSPAKINFMLAVTGRRPDGYHDLVSVVAPLTFGDTIRLRRIEGTSDVRLTCDDPAVPTGAENLAVRAAEAFRRATDMQSGIAIELTKRIPMGAGLGGGSSNAVAVLRGLNVLHGAPLSEEQLAITAATIGSDCPLFLAGGVCVMRGRGERIAHLPPQVRHRFASLRLLLFKPDFSVATPWAFAQLARAPDAAYLDAAAAEARLATWFGGSESVASLLFNSFESVVFRKYRALPAITAILHAQAGVEGVLMSGSGSACFALLSAAADSAQLTARIRAALGAHAFVDEARVG